MPEVVVKWIIVNKLYVEMSLYPVQEEEVEILGKISKTRSEGAYRLDERKGTGQKSRRGLIVGKSSITC